MHDSTSRTAELHLGATQYFGSYINGARRLHRVRFDEGQARLAIRHLQSFLDDPPRPSRSPENART